MTLKGKSELVVAFLPHKPYHLDILKGCLSLSNKNWKAIIIDSSAYYLDPSVEQTPNFINEHELAKNFDIFSLETLLQENNLPSALVVFNDWERTARIIVEAYNELKLPTVAIAEGVQDYNDELSNNPRFPYKSVKHVLLPCEYDKKYFSDPKQSVGVIGNPRISQLILDTITKNTGSKKIIINYNFSYGVFSDIKEEWLKNAVEAVLTSGFEPLISIHPSESVPKGFESYVSHEGLYQLLSKCTCMISRFSTVILECLALKVPVVYFPPANENVDKFIDQSGVIPLATNKNELIKLLTKSVGFQLAVEPTDNFLKLHTGLHLNHKERFMRRIGLILKTSFITEHKRKAASIVLTRRLSSVKAINSHYLKSQLKHRTLCFQKPN